MDRRKRALVTGGATGIGRAAVLHLARAGFDIALNYRSSAEAARAVAAEAEAAGAKVLLLAGDVADDVQVRAMLKQVEATFGGLDALINNAGTTISTPPKDLDAVSVDDWDRVFAVNVRGPFLVTRAAVPLLKRGENPSIVNTASIVGLRPGPQPLPYAASKAAIVSLTKQLAGALGPEIRVNAVAPGWMEGEWMERMLGDNYGRLMERRAKATPLGRCVTADDVAERLIQNTDAARLAGVRANADRYPTRIFANASVNTAWRNGPVESIHAGRYRGYPLDQRRITAVEERELMDFASQRLALGMAICSRLVLEPQQRPWREQVLPYGLAEILMVTPTGWTLTESSRDARLPA